MSQEVTVAPATRDHYMAARTHVKRRSSRGGVAEHRLVDGLAHAGLSLRGAIGGHCHGDVVRAGGCGLVGVAEAEADAGYGSPGRCPSTNLRAWD